MNLDKLKESARKFEQSGQWRQAIDVYKQALKEFEERGEGVLDPSLYNRIGDLEIKDGDSGAAIRAYEQASDLYTEQGFFNNAIALCSKILRINSGRSATYLRLAQLNARKNFVGEAKRNLVEYIERMEALAHRDDAFKAIEIFAEQFASNPEVRLMLVDLLRSSSRENEARLQLERLANDLDVQGDTSAAQAARERLAEMTDGAAPVAQPVAPTKPPRTSHSGLVFLDVGLPAGDATTSVDGLDIVRDPDAVTEEWQTDTDDFDDGVIPILSSEPVEDHVPDLLKEDPLDDEAETLAESDSGPLDIDAYPAVEGARSGAQAPTGDLVFIPVAGDETSDEAAPSTDDLAVFSRDRSRVLFEIGDRAGGIAALEEAVRQFEGTNRFDEAIQAVDDLVRVEPDAIFRYQKRVELAYRLGDREAMLQSYLGLADALLRSGGLEHAVTVYRRIIEHDPENAQAKAALNMLAPPPPPPPTNFVDLGALILETPQTRDTRIRIDQQTPIEDEDEAFHEALAQFKRGIDENIDAEDFQAHYDLGIAFKEMGLLDEAIAQFQKALRAPEGRLKTSEQLGIAFYDKSRFAIAEAVLRRAAESLPGGDEEKIGLIYWLARALEAQRRFEESLKYYERVLAVDIRFLDVGDRVHRLTTGAS